MPERIQRKRTKGWKMPENTVYVGRPSLWGNPYFVGHSDARSGSIVSSREDAVRLFRERTIGENMASNSIWFQMLVSNLRGKNLACWCRLDQCCHADVLLEIANREA